MSKHPAPAPGHHRSSSSTAARSAECKVNSPITATSCFMLLSWCLVPVRGVWLIWIAFLDCLLVCFALTAVPLYSYSMYAIVLCPYCMDACCIP